RPSRDAPPAPASPARRLRAVRAPARSSNSRPACRLRGYAARAPFVPSTGAACPEPAPPRSRADRRRRFPTTPRPVQRRGKADGPRYNRRPRPSFRPEAGCARPSGLLAALVDVDDAVEHLERFVARTLERVAADDRAVAAAVANVASILE